jgi:hypothetical protein
MQTSICLAIHGFIGRPFLPRAPAFLHGFRWLACCFGCCAARSSCPHSHLTHSYSLSHFSGLLACLLACSLACLLAHFTYTIFQYGIPLNSPIFSAGFPLSPATLTGTRTFTSQPRPHPIHLLLLAGPLTVARLARPAYRSAHRIPPSNDRLHHLRAARDTLKPNSRHPVVEATAC